MNLFKGPTLCFLLIVLMSCRQELRPSCHDLIDAENHFAELSKETNSRSAFLSYLTDSSVLCNSGYIIKGKDSWQQRKPDSTLLFWWPNLAGISSDGDIGFTSGPWEWRPDRSKEPPVAFGYFASIWRYQPSVGWKLCADMGISLPSREKTPAPLRLITPEITTSHPEISVADFFTLDKDYQQQLNKRGVSFLANRISVKGRLLRPNQTPFDLPLVPRDVLGTYTFSSEGGALSSSKDLGYSFGTVEIRIPSSESVQKRCYQRIWKCENGEWKIILDVIAGG